MLHIAARCWPWLAAIVLGHVVSVGVMVAAVVLGIAMDRVLMQVLAGGLCVVAAMLASVRHAGFALGSFVMSTAHGAGMALVPALMPLCTTA